MGYKFTRSFHTNVAYPFTGITSTKIKFYSQTCIESALTRSYQNSLFCDSSQKAYECAIYRTFKADGVGRRLLCGKSRVTPLKKEKKIEIARLQLCGAVSVLGIELLSAINNYLPPNMKIDLTRIWCDNQVVLCWITSPYTPWLPLVANRVKKVQDQKALAICDFIESEYNPVDVLTRGLMFGGRDRILLQLTLLHFPQR